MGKETANNEAEQCALAWMLSLPDAMETAAQKLTAKHFASEAHSTIFTCMLDILESGKHPSTLLVQDWIIDHNQSDTIGGIDYILQLLACLNFSLDFETPLAMIQECAKQRAVLMLGSKVYGMAQEGASYDAIQALIENQKDYIDSFTDATRRIPFQPVSFDDDDTPPEWYINRILAVNAVAGMYGDSESGKSLVAIDWAMHTAMGWRWRGREVKQGHVFYIAAEGAFGIKFRMRAWCLEHNVAYAAVSRYIHIIPEAVPLMTSEKVTQAIAAIKTIPVDAESPLRLVIFDTLNRSMEGGDENNQNDMRDALSSVSRVANHFGCAGLVIHHSNKSGIARGSIVFGQNLDTIIKVNQEDGIVTVACEKQKDGAPYFMPIRNEIASVGHPDWQDYTAPVLVCAKAEAVQEEMAMSITGNQLVALMALGREWLTYSQWQAASEGIDADTKKRKEKFDYARDQLVKKKLVKKAQEGYRLTPDGIQLYIQNGGIAAMPQEETGAVVSNLKEPPDDWNDDQRYTYYKQNGLSEDESVLRIVRRLHPPQPGNPNSSYA